MFTYYIDKSTTYIKIIFSLLDGKAKSAPEITNEWGKIKMDDRTREGCNELVNKGLLTSKSTDKRKNIRYTLNLEELANLIYSDEFVRIVFKNRKGLEESLRSLSLEDIPNFFIEGCEKIKRGDFANFVVMMLIINPNRDIGPKSLKIRKDIYREIDELKKKG